MGREGLAPPTEVFIHTEVLRARPELNSVIHMHPQNIVAYTIAEKPLLPYWMNAGVYVFSREFFRRLPLKGDHEDTAFPALSVQGKLFGYRSKAYWRTVDTFKDLTEAEHELAEITLG